MSRSGLEVRCLGSNRKLCSDPSPDIIDALLYEFVSDIIHLGIAFCGGGGGGGPKKNP
jgi:hypothetical protein